MITKDKETQELCDHFLSDLFSFAKYINPHYMYGEVHEEVFRELQFNEEPNQLYLIPRGHLKSHCIAVWCAWWITKYPWTSVVYLTAGQDLAEVQMDAIKKMLTCQEYVDLWPEMLETNEADRDKWTTTKINVDHPLRREMRPRDHTLVIKTVKSSATGLHCDALVYDDIVVPANAYTESGRKEVSKAVTEFVAIKNPGAVTKAVGTRYTDKDIYGQFKEATVPVYDDETGELVDERPLWWVMERKVESRGTGRGQFLWPRTKSPITGIWYGFDANELLIKKAEMLAGEGKLAHFFAQYYNETNSDEELREDDTVFQYYDKKYLTQKGDQWFFKNKPLKLGAGMDLAYNENAKQGDYTAICVIGIDPEGFIYLLDLVQFKTTKNKVYYDHLFKLHDYWGFRRVYVDHTGSGKVVVRSMQSLAREEGLSLVIEGKGYTSHDGAKEERFAATVEPRYESRSIWHYKGGLVPELEDQVKKPRPTNDDLEDALFIALDNTKPPSRGSRASGTGGTVIISHNRFGGRRRVS